MPAHGGSPVLLAGLTALPMCRTLVMCVPAHHLHPIHLDPDCLPVVAVRPKLMSQCRAYITSATRQPVQPFYEPSVAT